MFQVVVPCPSDCELHSIRIILSLPIVQISHIHFKLTHESIVHDRQPSDKGHSTQKEKKSITNDRPHPPAMFNGQMFVSSAKTIQASDWSMRDMWPMHVTHTQWLTEHMFWSSARRTFSGGVASLFGRYISELMMVLAVSDNQWDKYAAHWKKLPNTNYVSRICLLMLRRPSWNWNDVGVLLVSYYEYTPWFYTDCMIFITALKVISTFAT